MFDSLKRTPTMALTKAEMASTISEVLLIDKKKAFESVEKIVEVIKSTLESGEDVLISGFGKFCVNEKSKRKGRNPATGEDLMLSARTNVTFKCSGKLRQQMNKKKFRLSS
jgi:integration host factor subunit alpha